MNAQERATRDEAHGDLGGARRRLMSRAIQAPFDADLFERIARLSLRMGDPAEAGRWYATIDSSDADAPRAIAAFLDRVGGSDALALSHVPSIALQRHADSLPPSVRSRFPSWDRARAGRRLAGHERPTPEKHAETWFDWLAPYGCLAAILTFFACAFVGFGFFLYLLKRTFLG